MAWTPMHNFSFSKRVCMYKLRVCMDVFLFTLVVSILGPTEYYLLFSSLKVAAC